VGLSEQRLGDFLAGRPRSEFAICTKVGRRLVPASGPVEGVDEFYGTPALSRVRDYSADGVRRCLEDSLRRLRLDRVDIALIHDPDDFMRQALDSAYPALAGLRAAGVVGAIGVGMNAAAPLAWFVSRADLDCVLVAGRYSLLDTSAAAELLPLCADRGVKVLAGGVFNSGILADPRDGAHYDYAPAPAEVLARARRIRDICDAYGVPVAAAALRFTLRHPAVTAAVVGARSAAEITTDASYLTLDIPDELFAVLATALPDRHCIAAGARPAWDHYRMDHGEALVFAEQWVRDWNAHDIDALLKHFTDDIVFTSPVAVRLLGGDGVVRGKEALRKYWTEGVRLIPDLRFEVLAVYAGIDTLVINYRNQAGGVVCEVLTFDGPLVREGHGTYRAQAPTGLEDHD